jgi:ferric iron reductase protein FhuF
MTAAAVALGQLTDLVSFLRWRIGPIEPGELASAQLAASPDDLAAAVADSAPGRGTEDLQVAASLWWQSYAYRVAGTTLGCWLVSGAAPDPAAAGMAVGIGRSRPSSVVWSAGVEVLDDLAALVTRLFDDHLDPVAESLRARHSLGAALIRGNVGAGIESAMAAVAGAPGAPDLRARIGDVRAALPAAVSDTIELLDDGYRRRACCLWWKTGESKGRLCADCSLPAPPAA